MNAENLLDRFAVGGMEVLGRFAMLFTNKLTVAKVERTPRAGDSDADWAVWEAHAGGSEADAGTFDVYTGASAAEAGAFGTDPGT